MDRRDPLPCKLVVVERRRLAGAIVITVGAIAWMVSVELEYHQSEHSATAGQFMSSM